MKQNPILSLLSSYLSISCFFLLLSSSSLLAQGNNYCEIEPCPCEGNYSQIQLYYFGTDAVDIDVYRDQAASILVTSLNNVNTGDLITIDGTGSLGGALAPKTYLHVRDAMGEVCVIKIRTTCPTVAWPWSLEDLKIVGKSYGDFTVYSRTDSESNFLCDISNVAQDWHVGGNIISPDNNTLGTRNDESVVFITNDVARGTMTNTGAFGINTLTPNAQLDVQGDVLIDQTLDVHGITTIHDANSASSPATGALVVSGGAGIGENLYVADNANIGQDLAVTNNASVGNNLDVSNNTTTGQDLSVGNDANVTHNLTVGDNASVGQDLAVANNANVGNNLAVSNNTTTGQNLSVGNDAIVTNDLSIGNNASVGSDLHVTNQASVGLNLSVGNDANVSNDLDVNGDANVDGLVTIGTNNTPNQLAAINIAQYHLFVEGGILTEEVLVRTGWADYVFEEGYQHPSLEEIEAHIKAKGHLPNVPSAASIETNGLELGDATVFQQEKIEELFLHLIEMNKTIKALQAENQALRMSIEELKK